MSDLIERLKARIELSAGCCYGDMPDCSDEMNAAIKEIERLWAVVAAARVVIKCEFPTLDTKDDPKGALALLNLAERIAALDGEREQANSEVENNE